MILMVTKRESFDFIAGWSALDFANAFGARRSDLAYTTLVDWSEQAGMVTAPEARRLRERAKRQPAASRKVATRAGRLAGAVKRIYEAVIDDQPPDGADLTSLNTELTAALGHLTVAPDNGTFRLDWAAVDDQLDRVLWPVARSAADLLVAPELDRLKACDSPTCGYLFVDASKPGRRRWCDMKVCGNRHKARRHRRRQKRKA